MGELLITVATDENTPDRIHVREFLLTLHDEDLDRAVEFAVGGSPRQTMRLEELLHHAPNHGVHQRGQVALLLRSLGYAPGNFAILVYYGGTD